MLVGLYLIWAIFHLLNKIYLIIRIEIGNIFVRITSTQQLLNLFVFQLENISDS